MNRATKIILAAFLSLTMLGVVWILNKEHANIAVPSGHPAHSNHSDTAQVQMYNCAMHPNYISEKPGTCPFCGMDLTPMEKQVTNSSKGVQIDPNMIQTLGVRTEVVTWHEMQTDIRASGKVQVDESKVFIISTRVMGYVEKLFVNTTGAQVNKGQNLLDLYSPDLVSAQEEFLTALRFVKATSGSPDIGSQELLESSRRRLQNWGITSHEIADLEKKETSHRTLSITSPTKGIVLEKMVVEGQNIMAGMMLYRIADLSKVWVVAAIYQRDLSKLKIGSEAQVELSYGEGKIFPGKVVFISPTLDPISKTAEARIEIANTPELDIKPEMFATVRILSKPSKTANAGTRVLAVPDQAIIRSGERNIAIIDMGNGTFEPREIQLGPVFGDYVEVQSGIQAGENLVVSSQFLIDSESNLKAAIQQMRAGK